jgi:hypothetical protein
MQVSSHRRSSHDDDWADLVAVEVRESDFTPTWERELCRRWHLRTPVVERGPVGIIVCGRFSASGGPLVEFGTDWDAHVAVHLPTFEFVFDEPLQRNVEKF